MGLLHEILLLEDFHDGLLVDIGGVAEAPTDLLLVAPVVLLLHRVLHTQVVVMLGVPRRGRPLGVFMCAAAGVAFLHHYLE